MKFSPAVQGPLTTCCCHFVRVTSPTCLSKTWDISNAERPLRSQVIWSCSSATRVEMTSNIVSTLFSMPRSINEHSHLPKRFASPEKTGGDDERWETDWTENKHEELNIELTERRTFRTSDYLVGCKELSQLSRAHLGQNDFNNSIKPNCKKGGKKK